MIETIGRQNDTVGVVENIEIETERGRGGTDGSRGRGMRRVAGDTETENTAATVVIAVTVVKEITKGSSGTTALLQPDRLALGHQRTSTKGG